VNNGLVLGALAVVAVVVIAALVTRSRRANDGVDSFRRQIDALSPEARRPVIDQVQSAAVRVQRESDDDHDAEHTDDQDHQHDDDDLDPDGGPRGA
jgi:hypothetical protein